MPTQHNFTQALAHLPWYKATPESRELLKELDKDLRKWDAHVSSDAAHAFVVAEALFNHVRYRFTMRVHARIQEINAIDPMTLSVTQRAVLKTHLRQRNVLKNFLPVVFDRLSAERQFSLVAMYVNESSKEQTSHCIWACNTAGLGLSIVTTAEPETLLHGPSIDAPAQAQPQQVQQAPAAVH